MNEAKEVANKIKTEAQAYIENIYQTTSALASSLNATQEVLDFTTAEEKIAYYYLQLLKDQGGQKLLNFPSTAALKCIQNDNGLC